MPTLRPTGIALAVLALAAALAVAGCGSGSDETSTVPSTSTTPEKEAPVGVRADVCKNEESADGEVRATGLPCNFSRLVVKAWHTDERCDYAPGASRTSCRLGGFTCLGAATGRGLAVTCATHGRSVAFLAEPR